MYDVRRFVILDISLKIDYDNSVKLKSQGGYTELHFMMTFVIVTVVLTACALRNIGVKTKDEPAPQQKENTQAQGDGYWGPKNSKANDSAYDHSAQNRLSVFSF